MSDETTKHVSVFDAFGTNENGETDGIWCDFYGVNGTHVRVKVARMGGNNTAYARKMQQLTKPYRKGSVDGTPNIPAEADKSLFIKAIAETIVKDWQGVYDTDGNEVACTPENVERVLSRASILLEFISSEARNIDNYAISANESIAKN